MGRNDSSAAVETKIIVANRYTHCIIGFSQFWIHMADKEIKGHRRVIQMIFPMIQMAKYDRPVQSACLFYENGQKCEMTRAQGSEMFLIYTIYTPVANTGIQKKFSHRLPL